MCTIGHHAGLHALRTYTQVEKDTAALQMLYAKKYLPDVMQRVQQASEVGPQYRGNTAQASYLMGTFWLTWRTFLNNWCVACERACTHTWVLCSS